MVTKIEDVLEKERDLIVSSFNETDAIAYNNMTVAMDQVLQPFELIGETMYHSAKYTNMKVTMVQELIETINGHDSTAPEEEKIATPQIDKLVWSTVKQSTKNTMEMVTWTLETGHVHVTQPVLHSVAALGDILFSGENCPIIW